MNCGKVLTVFGLCLDFVGAFIMSWYYIFLTEGKAAIDGALLADGGDSQIKSLISQSNYTKVGFVIITLGFLLQLIGGFFKEYKNYKSIRAVVD